MQVLCVNTFFIPYFILPLWINYLNTLSLSKYRCSVKNTTLQPQSTRDATAYMQIFRQNYYLLRNKWSLYFIL